MKEAIIGILFIIVILLISDSAVSSSIEPNDAYGLIPNPNEDNHDNFIYDDIGSDTMVDVVLTSSHTDTYTHDDGDGKTYAKDGGENFAGDGVAVGWFCRNIDDGNDATVTSFPTADQANLGTIANGVQNDFDATGNEQFHFWDFGCEKDTSLNEALPDQNYGIDDTFEVGGVVGASEHRGLLQFLMPANPYPNADISIKKVIIKLKCDAIAAGNIVVYMYKLNHNNWVEGNVNAAAGDASWNEYGTGTSWQASGGDHDTSIDWVGFGSGIIAEKYISSTDWYSFDISAFIEKDNISWGDRFSILMKAPNGAGDTVTFNSRDDSTNDVHPILEITYVDPAPTPAKINATWNKDKQKVEISTEIPNDKDFVQMFIRRDTSAGVSSTDGSAAKVDFDSLENQTYITNKSVKSVLRNHTTLAAPAVDTFYYLRAFTEDNNNTGADATPSNEVSFIRPEIKTGGSTGEWFIINSAGAGGSSLNVMDDVFVHVVPDVTNVSLDSMKEVEIDWGDGGTATYDWWAANPSADPAASTTTLTVTDTTGLKINDYVVISEGANTLARKITGLTPTVITLESALAPDFSTSATIVKTRKHQYSSTGTKSVTLRLTNSNGFQSLRRACTTTPDLVGIDPIAVLDLERTEWNTGDTIVCSGVRSIVRNLDKPILWNTTIGPYEHSTGGTITAYADAGGGEVTVSCAAHGLSAGNGVKIRGSTNYNGAYSVVSTNADDFNVTVAWAGDDAAGYAGTLFPLDSGEDFPGDSVIAGYLVYNVDDNSHGVVETITGTDKINLVGTTLSGGTNNVMTKGDEFYIYASAWVCSDLDPTFSARAAPVTTITSSSTGSAKTLKLHVCDALGNYNQATKSFDINAAAKRLYHSGWVVDNAYIGGGETITINSTTLTEGVDFSKGGSSTATATAMATAINSSLTDNHAVAAGDVCVVTGHVTACTSNDSDAFAPELRIIGTRDIKKTTSTVVKLTNKLNTTGHIRNIISRGSIVYNISGVALDVDTKDMLEEINDGTAEYLLMVIDGSLRKLYPLTKVIVIRETSRQYVPQDQSTGTTGGTWEFSGMFVDGGVYSV